MPPLPPPAGRASNAALFFSRLLLPLLLLLPVPAAHAASTPITSADRRFCVSGLSPEQNFLVASRLSEAARALERRTGLSAGDRTLAVAFRPAASPAARIRRSQGWQANRLVQKIDVPFPADEDLSEDILAAALWLLIDRMAAPSVPRSLRSGFGPAAPEWLAHALAILSDPDLKADARARIARDLLSGTPPPSLHGILSLEFLPEGPWREKAYAAAALDFLLPQKSPELWPPLLRALALAQPLDADFFRALPSSPLAAPDPHRAWLQHLDAFSARASTPADLPSADAALSRILALTPSQLLPHHSAPLPSLPALEFPDHPSAPWLPPAAAALALHLRTFALSAPDPLRPAAAAYADFAEILASPPGTPAPDFPWRTARPPAFDDPAAWRAALDDALASASALRASARQISAERSAYLDAFDLPAPDSPSPSSPPPAPPPAPTSTASISPNPPQLLSRFLPSPFFLPPKSPSPQVAKSPPLLTSSFLLRPSYFLLLTSAFALPPHTSPRPTPSQNSGTAPAAPRKPGTGSPPATRTPCSPERPATPAPAGPAPASCAAR